MPSCALRSCQSRYGKSTGRDFSLFSTMEQDKDIHTHSLLEPPSSPAYTNATVRRAFIVWMYCGQKNQFRDVCNYYHHLEALEETLPADTRASSCHLEFSLFSKQPPTSDYLKSNFPQLYAHTQVENYNIKTIESIKNEKCVSQLEGFNESNSKNGSTKQEIVGASQMIRKYCKEHQKPLETFLNEYKKYAQKCELKNTVNNMEFYIKRKMVQSELELVANYPKTFHFLDTYSRKPSSADDVDNQSKLLAGMCLNSNAEDSIESDNNSETKSADSGIDLIDFSIPEVKLRAIKGGCFEKGSNDKLETIEKESHCLLDRDDNEIVSKDEVFSNSNFLKNKVLELREI